MGPLEITTILQLINAHPAQAHDIWKSLSAILNNRDEASLSQYILTFLQRQGFTTSLLNSHPLLLYGERRYETKPTLLCHIHYDPDAPTPLQMQVIATTLLSIITYQKILAIRADIPPITLKWVLSQKNVSHTLHFQQKREQLPALFQTDACLWYEPLLTESTIGGNSDSFILATGTKGYLSVDLQVQTAHSPLHSSYGAIAPNAAWRLLWALNSLKDRREEILIEGFYDTMIPLEDDILQQLADLPDTASTHAVSWGMPDLLLGLQGKQMHYAHILTPTCTINRLTSEEGATVPSDHSIPATARAIVDFYLVPGQDPADIFDKLKRHLRTCGFADIHVTLRYAGSPVYTPAHHRFVQQVAQSAEQVYGQPPIILPILPEHVPIQTLAQNPSLPVIILPLYVPEFQTQVEDEEPQALWKSIAHLTSIMLGYTR
jgi:hypothetical protein